MDTCSYIDIAVDGTDQKIQRESHANGHPISPKKELQLITCVAEYADSAP
jgi:hypothetical protein